MRFLIFIFIASSIVGCQSQTSEKSNDLPGGQTLFEKLDAQQTGVRFTNRINENEQINILTYEYLYNGSGVAIGDFNNDQLPDLYFSATNGSNRLYMNAGNWQFTDITTASGTGVSDGFSTGVSMVDINGDGWLDIYVCRTGKFATSNRENLCFINNKNGTFRESAHQLGLADPSFSNQAVFFDFDRDNDLDMYLVNHPVDFKNANNIALTYEGQKLVKATPQQTALVSDRLYRNDNGHFVDITNQAGITNYAFGLSATVIDVNDDGWPDVYVANDYIEPDYLYVNNRDGTFSESLSDYIRVVSHNSMGSDVADINNDGMEDIVVLDMVAEDNYRQKILANVMKYDRYATQVKYGYFHQQMRNMLQINNGNGSFSEVGQLAGISNTDWSWGPLLADFNLDGWKDLFIANGYRRDITNLDYMNYTLDSLNKAGGIEALNTIYDLLNKVPETPIKNYMFKNTGGITFDKVTHAWGLDHASWSNGAAYGDLDNDGDLDIVVNNVNQPAFIYRNTAVSATANNWLTVTLKGPGNNTKGIGASVAIWHNGHRQLQRLMPSRGYMSTMEPALHFGLGSVDRVDSLMVYWPDGFTSSVKGIAANQEIEIDYSKTAPSVVVENKTPANTLLQELPQGAGLQFAHKENAFIDTKREPLLHHGYSQLGPAVAAGDLNGDGLDDCLVGGGAGQAPVLFIQQENSTFRPFSQPVFTMLAAREVTDIALLDIDDDADLDVYLVHGGSAWPANDERYQDVVLRNDGSGHFTIARNLLPNMPTSSSCAAVIYLAGDQRPDLFVGGRVTPGKYPVAPRSYVLQHQDGRWVDVTASVAPALQYAGMVSGAVAEDFNKDGYEDLMIAGEWMPLQYFEGSASGLRAQPQAITGASKGWWQSLAPADVDGDGDVDCIAGNLGLNGPLQASAGQPLRLFYSDFDQNGFIDPIMEMAYTDGRHPVPTRDQFVNQIPAFKSRVLRYRFYAQATMADLFTPDELSAADTLSIHTLANSWVENMGDGSWTLHQLPEAAQWAPIMALSSLATTSGGAPWIFTAGNIRNVNVYFGQYNAGNGQMLQYQPNGTWNIPSIVASGFFVPGDVRDMDWITLANGRKMLVVGENEGPLSVFLLDQLQHQVKPLSP